MAGQQGVKPPSLRSILRELRWALKSRVGRMALAFAITRNIPGNYGALIRERILRPHFKAAGEGLRIFQGVRIRNIHLLTCGRNVQIGDEVFIQAGGGLELGDNVLLGPGAKIWTQNHVVADPDTPILEQGAEYRPVVIEADCWIGADAFIMPGVHLPRGCVVAAGSVVGAKRYKEYQLLMGNPARSIGFRKQPAKVAPEAAPGDES
jgi:acetyltransferase-like isoleucine patch superfamily enzyme